MVENYQEMLSSEHSGFIRHNGIRVVSVDEEKSVLTADVTPDAEKLAAAFGIRSIPTLLFIPMEGKPQMAQGALPKASLKEAIDKVMLGK